MIFMSYVNDSGQGRIVANSKDLQVVFCPTMTCGTLEMCLQS